MPEAAVNDSTSSALTKPPLIVTVADSMLVPSTSVIVRLLSITAAASPSVTAGVLPAPDMTGASFTAWIVIGTVEATTFAEIAPELKRRWRCPHAKYTPDPRLLDAECREVLEAVERLTGARCDTCPLAGPRQPWVAYAVEARAWAERGHLDLYAPATPHVLIDAVSLVDRGIAQRQARDAENAKRRTAAAPPSKPDE